MKTLCFTGHRQVPTHLYEEVMISLVRKINTAARQGYTRFISGFAQGVDLMAAEAFSIVKEMGHYNITLAAYIPYAARKNCTELDFQKHLALCDEIQVISAKYYPGCFQQRNQAMVDSSQLVIAVYDGRGTGGTYQTVRYAVSQRKEVWQINWNQPNTIH